jgi:lipopolysaccharide export LptBFGC system permease protein LptF
MKSKILKKNKKAIFLSMELIVVLTVITSLLSVTTFMGLRVYQNSKITKIINQIDEIRASISSFESTFGFYPGDVNLEVINSGINLSIVKNNYAKVITAEESTDGNVDSLFTSAKSDSIAMQK